MRSKLILFLFVVTFATLIPQTIAATSTKTPKTFDVKIIDAYYTALDDEIEDDVVIILDVEKSTALKTEIYVEIVLPSGKIHAAIVTVWTFRTQFTVKVDAHQTAEEPGWYTVNSIGILYGGGAPKGDVCYLVFDPPGKGGANKPYWYASII